MELGFLLSVVLVAWWTLPGRFDSRVLRRTRGLTGAELVRVMRGER